VVKFSLSENAGSITSRNEIGIKLVNLPVSTVGT
jgi:hypothetical protein